MSVCEGSTVSTIPGLSWKKNLFLSFEACWQSSANSVGHLNVGSYSARLFCWGVTSNTSWAEWAENVFVSLHPGGWNKFLYVSDVQQIPQKGHESWELKTVPLLFNPNPHWSYLLCFFRKYSLDQLGWMGKLSHKQCLGVFLGVLHDWFLWLCSDQRIMLGRWSEHLFHPPKNDLKCLRQSFYGKSMEK